MKKLIIAVCLLVVMMVTSVMPAFAADSLPADLATDSFSNSNWNENYGRVSMLNFGHVYLNLGENIYKANNANKCVSGAEYYVDGIENLLSEGNTFYVYTKLAVRNAYYLDADATVVMTAPDGQYYVVEDNKDLSTGCGWHTTKWFIPMNDLLKRCSSDNGGTMPAGTYQLTLFINNDPARTASFKIIERKAEDPSTDATVSWQLED